MWLRPRAQPPNLSVLDELQVGVIVLDEDDRIVLANPAARRMGMVRRGQQQEELAVVAVRTLVAKARRRGVCRQLELDLPRGRRTGGGSGLVGVNVRVAPVTGGYVTVEVADVTEAHRLARVRRDFVANVSHELKTPVGALRLLAEALIEATTGGEEPPSQRLVSAEGLAGQRALAGPDLVAVRRFAERIRHESTRLGRLVGDLLELTRLQGAEPLPELAPVPVDSIIAEVVDRNRTEATAKGIELAVAGTTGLTAYGNESQLVTAVANLVENAIAYSPDQTTVTLTVQSRDEQVEIIVTDQGIGIEAKDLDRIFERFYRADRARSRATGGTGLGLAIVKHVATNHGGQVTVTSTVGVGSTFTLVLSGRPPQDTWPGAPGGVLDTAQNGKESS